MNCLHVGFLGKFNWAYHGIFGSNLFHAQVSYYKYPGTKLENSNAAIYQGMVHIFKYKVCVYTSTAPFINPESIYRLYSYHCIYEVCTYLYS